MRGDRGIAPFAFGLSCTRYGHRPRHPVRERFAVFRPRPHTGETGARRGRASLLRPAPCSCLSNAGRAQSPGSTPLCTGRSRSIAILARSTVGSTVGCRSPSRRHARRASGAPARASPRWISPRSPAAASPHVATISAWALGRRRRCTPGRGARARHAGTRMCSGASIEPRSGSAIADNPAAWPVVAPLSVCLPDISAPRFR